jgi:rod shape-determining protein MreD
MNGRKTGAGLGFAYGLMEDLIVGKYIGLQTLTKMLTGYLIGLLERKIFSDNILVPVVVGALGTIIHNLLVFVALFLIGNFDVFTPSNFIIFTSASCVYNLCVSVLVYGPFYRSNSQGFFKAT